MDHIFFGTPLPSDLCFFESIMDIKDISKQFLFDVVIETFNFFIQLTNKVFKYELK